MTRRKSQSGDAAAKGAAPSKKSDRVDRSKLYAQKRSPADAHRPRRGHSPGGQKAIPTEPIVPINYLDAPATIRMTRAKQVPMPRSYRKQLVAHYYLTGRYTKQADIAEVLKEEWGVSVSQPTVCQDLAQLKNEWDANAALSFDARVRQELARLDTLEVSATKMLKSGKVRDFCSTMLKVSKARRMLLGLDKPQKFQVNAGDDAESLTDAQLEDIIKKRNAQGDNEDEEQSV